MQSGTDVKPGSVDSILFNLLYTRQKQGYKSNPNTSFSHIVDVAHVTMEVMPSPTPTPMLIRFLMLPIHKTAESWIGLSFRW